MNSTETKSFSTLVSAPCSSYKPISEPNQIDKISCVVHDLNSFLQNKQLFFHKFSWMLEAGFRWTLLSSAPAHAMVWQPHLKEKSCILTLIKLFMCPPLAKPQHEVPYDAFEWC